MVRIRSQSDFIQAYGTDAELSALEVPAERKKRSKIRPEDTLQANCMTMIKARKDLHYIVCQPDRIKAPTYFMQNFLRKLGVFGNGGHPEVLIFPSNPADITLIELKTARGIMREEQAKWRVWCIERGYRHHVIRSLEDMERVLRGLR